MITLLVIFLLLIPQQGADSFEWNEDRPLKWSDFNGRPDQMSEHAAATHYEVHSMNSYPEQDAVQYEIVCRFNRKRSWVHPSERRNLGLLAHEQLHFDMAECAARTLRSVLHEPVSRLECNDWFMHKRDSVLQAWEEIQLEYDKQTGHGIDREAQKVWEKRISSTLNGLSDYSGTIFSVEHPY